jgi:beta-1,4-mannosyl-glycoprotein beta-1,4-N-acetylglucosaminyltransferase
VTIYDTFMANQELDMAECRFYELEDVPDLVHVVVEADVDHQDHPKPYHFTAAMESGRFDRWACRIRIVRASGLPTAADHPDPWAREHAQREHTREGLTDASPEDVVLHGDIDEIPTAVWVRNVRPQGYSVAGMKFHCFAVDWLHPHLWQGTVAARYSHITSFSEMRDARNHAKLMPGSGWHFSWVGGREYTIDKLNSFCHPEIAPRTLDGLEQDLFMGQGFHVDGKKLAPVEVGPGWPKWIREGHAPDSWYRPRVDAVAWTPPTGR